MYICICVYGLKGELQETPKKTGKIRDSFRFSLLKQCTDIWINIWWFSNVANRD